MSAILGEFKGRDHHYRLRIFYEDTDFSGAVYHANYLKYFERGRSSFLALLGVEHCELWSEHNRAFVISKMEIDYLKPAHVDDELTIVTRYETISGARMMIAQKCFRGDELLVEAICHAVIVTRDARPARAPKFLIDIIKPYLQD